MKISHVLYWPGAPQCDIDSRGWAHTFVYLYIDSITINHMIDIFPHTMIKRSSRHERLVLGAWKRPSILNLAVIDLLPAPFNVCLFTDLSTGSTSSASPVPRTPTVDASVTPKNLTPRKLFADFGSSDKMARSSFLQATDDTLSPLNSTFQRKDPLLNQSQRYRSFRSSPVPLHQSTAPILTPMVLAMRVRVLIIRMKFQVTAGQLVFWKSGSIWDNYAYEQYADDTLGWKPIGIEIAEWIRVQSTECTIYLATTPEEVNQSFWKRWSCNWKRNCS